MITASPKRQSADARKGLWRRGTALLLCLLLLGTAGCKKKEKPQSPEAYAMGQDVAPTLDSLLAEAGEGELASIAELDAAGEPVETPPEPEESPVPEGTAAPVVVSQYVYSYENLTSGGAAAQSYAELLALEENGFITLGEDGKPVDAPDYTATEGFVILAKDSKTEGTLLQIRLDWTETGCTVTVTNPEGTLKPEAEPQSMTVSEAVDFLQQMRPSDLGLGGESMEAYEIYPREGLVIADGYACIQLAVYHKTKAGTNAVEGIYLVTGDKAHIYSLDKQSGTIVEITVGAA